VTDGVLTSLPLPDLTRPDRAATRAYFDNTWSLTEVLFSSLRSEEAFYRPPVHGLRHPLVFYYCHPPVLYVNKLRVAGLVSGPIDATFERHFEVGVDEMAWDDLSKNDAAWPSLSDVLAYRREVYALVRRVIDEAAGLAEGAPAVTIDDPLWALYMGFEHERIHFETSSVLVRELPIELVQRPRGWPKLAPLGGSAPELAMVHVREGEAAMGKPRGWPSFGWDNEYGRRVTRVPAFEASRTLVTNDDFLRFVEAGGYRTPRYWSADGWAWRSFRNAKWPAFWLPAGPRGLSEFDLRTTFEVVPLPRAWPVVVNHYEAKAYCAWRTERDAVNTPYRLLTEAEHRRVHDGDAGVRDPHERRDPVMVTDGAGMATRFGRNLSLAFGSESAVDALPVHAGFHDVVGNVWHWCEDHFNPLPGFEMHPYYEDFSVPCFDGRHRMIVGGSFASTGDEASVWARFHFRPHFFQHAGFRVVRSDAPAPAVVIARSDSAEVYEQQKSLDEYMTLHYAAPSDLMPHASGPTGATEFPTRCARLLLEAAAAAGAPMTRALDLGCAVGRAAFELARGFDEVHGIDLSRAFIEAARTLKESGARPFHIREEGEVMTLHVATVDPSIDRARVTFATGDACALPDHLEGFDGVLMANLLCRLREPRTLLDRLTGPHALVRPGGFVALVSPYSWLAEFTPRGAWLGGFEAGGRATRGSDALRAILAPAFELVHEQDLPLVIREHARKFQYIVSHAMVWRRRA